MANKANIAKKEEQYKKLAEDLKNSNLVLLVDYIGIKVEDDTKLRKTLREASGKNTVIKNNIIKRALELNGYDDLTSTLVGPTAIISTKEDYLSVLKIAYNFSKDNENYKFKGGIIEGKAMSVDEIITLAKLPSREELLSKLAGDLLGTISKLAVALNEVSKQKESGSEPEKVEQPVQA